VPPKVTIRLKRPLEEASTPASNHDLPSSSPAIDTKPPRKRRKPPASKPRAKSKVRVGDDGEDDDGEYVAQAIHMEEEEATMEEKQGDEGGESAGKVRRSSRRRTTTQNKYVIYDNLDDDDYFHKIEKEAEAGRLDFVATILVHSLHSPSRGAERAAHLTGGTNTWT